MDILKKLVYICLPVFILTGCYSDFNPDEYSNPVLCLNSVISAGEPIEVSVSRTWRYNEPVDREHREVKDARISIYVNGLPKPSDYIASEGDEIRIVAESQEYGIAEASVKVPYSTPIEELEFIPYGVSSMKWNKNEYTGQDEFGALVYFDLEVRLRVKDKHPERDYFRLGVDAYSYGRQEEDNDDTGLEDSPQRFAYIWIGELDYNSDIIFKEHIGITESVLGGYETTQLFFTDRMFSQDAYCICLKFYGAYFEASGREFEDALLDCGIKFTLLTVSESYYNRMNYLWQKNSGMLGELSDLGLADAIWGYSNVSTGAGVVVAKTAYTYDLNLKDFLKDALEEVDK